ncbi:MAG TPA: glycine cleavage T C-terminal barrel domain-containing protein [Candidatus Methylomirabilis sp.]|nr:glycine cleavage T C-terminal barrel domain-containing protein [Candidatus Methylomirabilis sp.]HSD49904.1 glycine cleavage T C-terminal barrel domain-containing protein [Candidatus Methylomirabilis sp.]
MGRNFGLAYLPIDLPKEGAPPEIEVFGERIKAEVAADVLFDPKGERIRA